MKPLHGTSQRSRLMRTSCLHPSPFPLVWLTGIFPCCRAGNAACARQEPRLCRASRPPSLTGRPKSQGVQCWPVQECQGGLPCLPSEGGSGKGPFTNSQEDESPRADFTGSSQRFLSTAGCCRKKLHKESSTPHFS